MVVTPFFMTLSFWFFLFFGVTVLLLVVFLFKAVYIVQQAEEILVERLGKFHRILGPGLHVVIPLIEVPRKVTWTFLRDIEGHRAYRFTKTLYRVDKREAVYDFPRQNVITKDNIIMEINALIYYQITDTKLAVYEVEDLPEAIEKLTQTKLRDVIGELDLDQSLVSRDRINTKLRLTLDEATDKWGVKVNRVELQEVKPPEDIRQAMEKQMRAERDRRAMILESEGKKRAAILEAEGSLESQVLEAQGQAQARLLQAESESQARLLIAQAEATAIEMIQKSVPQGDPLPYLIAMQYIKVLPELTKGKDNKMIIVPYEASSLIGSLASVKKIFDNA